MRSGIGRESQLDLLPFACQWRTIPNVRDVNRIALPDNKGGTPKFPWYLVSMMDCGYLGHVNRGLLVGYAVNRGLPLPERSKRVGMRGRREGQLLAWILDWASHKGSVDELATWLCNKAKVSHG
jgi:hypothetical protein